MIHCTSCGLGYPEDKVCFRCPRCNGLFDITTFPDFTLSVDDLKRPGIWRYRQTFMLPETAAEISLGEGNTPLIWQDIFGKEVAFKLEYLNPTGSFKDRGAAVLVSFLVSRGVIEGLDDSSGNSGVSFSAYAARAGIKARVYLPDWSSRVKRSQIAAFGAEIVRIMGSRANATVAAIRAAEWGVAYASHAYLPQVLPGYATIAYELLDQLGDAPGTIIMPVGNGNLLLAIARAFQNLLQSGKISHLPVFVGVQARACSPIWSVLRFGSAGLTMSLEGHTLAEEIQIIRPLRGDAILSIINSSHGIILAVDEDEILPARDCLARLGFFVEPTSALVWNALEMLPDDIPQPVVALLTGSGLKVY